MRDLLGGARRFFAVASLATGVACCFAAADGPALERQGFGSPAIFAARYAMLSGLTGTIFGSGLAASARALSIAEALIGLLFLGWWFTIRNMDGL